VQIQVEAIRSEAGWQAAPFHNQGCQIFWHNIPKRGIYQIATKLPNGHKMCQMAIIYIFQMGIKYSNLFHSNALRNLPKLGFFVWKITIWQPCSQCHGAEKFPVGVASHNQWFEERHLCWGRRLTILFECRSQFSTPFLFAADQPMPWRKPGADIVKLTAWRGGHRVRLQIAGSNPANV
jgi:hypothetical protein